MSIVRHVKRFWRFHSLALGALGLAVLTLGCAANEPAFYEGTWVVTEAYLPTEGQPSVTETKRILGSSITYSSAFAKLDQDVCETPTYQSKQVTTDMLEASYQVSSNELGFSAGSITQIQLSCTNQIDTVGATLLFQDDTLAYTTVDGALFKIEKTL